ncbi:alpha/beta fold hydrolase [Microbacterium sp. RD1]|uniref:alpha/beta fold hydrolase n=1 Tax=Microbacterium sp. RD1 TaxID=3457313 RepID=UPI003FA60BE2
MTTYVLVHGSWGGGWVWRALAEELERSGHRVLVPTLTGLGSDASNLRPDITLDDHIRVVADSVAETGDEVILVGHSYGTVPACGAVATAAGRAVRQLVLLDGFIPTPGRSVFDDRPDVADILAALAAPHGGLYAEPAPPSAYGIDDAEIADWLTEASTLMPMSVLRQPFPSSLRSVDELDDLDVTYVRFTGTDLFLSAEETVRARGWAFEEVDGHHFAFVTQPRTIAAKISIA